MSKASQAYVPPAALGGSMRDFRTVKGTDLLSRISPFYQWQNLRRQHGLWPFSRSTDNGIMVVTEGLFSMDSDTPDILAFQALCDEYGATLLVDVAHDLGNLGPDGRGHIGMQNAIGKVDLVMGSFSKTFGSNGGFVTCRNRALNE